MAKLIPVARKRAPGRIFHIDAADYDPDNHIRQDEPGALPDGYRVESGSGWYKAIGPDGEQVGDAQRSRTAAEAEARDAGG